MKIEVVECAGEYTIVLKHGVQQFEFRYRGSKAECQWYARMVRKAIRAYGNEKK